MQRLRGLLSGRTERVVGQRAARSIEVYLMNRKGERRVRSVATYPDDGLTYYARFGTIAQALAGSRVVAQGGSLVVARSRSNVRAQPGSMVHRQWGANLYVEPGAVVKTGYDESHDLPDA